MEFAPYKTAIYNWFSKQSNITAIWADQSKVRPKRPYATLKIITGTVKLGGQDNLRDGPAGRPFVLNGPRQISLSVNVYGEDAMDILTTVRDSLDDPAVIDDLDAHGLAVTDDGSVQNVTEALESHFEPRAQMDVVFMLQEERDAFVVPVDRINLNGTDVV